MEYATPEQRSELFALRAELGITNARVREILQAVTGQQLTAEIPADRFDAVMEALRNEAQE